MKVSETSYRHLNTIKVDYSSHHHPAEIHMDGMGLRKTVVHGATDQEMADKIKKITTDKVKDYYNTYRSNPTLILSKYSYLFTSRTLTQWLKLDIDSMNC
jgi:hypothetical protein